VRKYPPIRILDKPQRRGAVDQQIDEAIARGEWNNLRGKGKPLDLNADLADRKAMRSKLRRDANFTTPWQDVGVEIEMLTRAAERELVRVLEFRRTGLASRKADPAKVGRDFERGLESVERAIAAVNSAILKHNLLIPVILPHLHRRRLKLEALLDKVAPELKGGLKLPPPKAP